MKTKNPHSGQASAVSPQPRKSTRAPAMIAGRTGQPGTAKSKAKSKASNRGQHHGNGHGNGNGNGHAPTPGLRGAGRGRAARAAAAQATYDTGLRFDSGLHYVADDPLPPPPMGAKVRLELATKKDAELAAFAEAHIAAMLNNPNFLTPTPTALIFGQRLADYEEMLAQYEAAKVTLKNLTEQKDALRAALCAVFTQRGQYVEMTSNGDPDIIATSALPVKRAPTPVGQLSWPLALEVIQSNTPGELLLKWKAVTGARGYVLQCAEVVEGQPRQWGQVYAGGKPTSAQKPLTPGKVYEFRVAAMGGSTGQSDWSPVVSRMAA